MDGLFDEYGDEKDDGTETITLTRGAFEWMIDTAVGKGFDRANPLANTRENAAPTTRDVRMKRGVESRFDRLNARLGDEKPRQNARGTDVSETYDDRDDDADMADLAPSHPWVSRNQHGPGRELLDSDDSDDE